MVPILAQTWLRELVAKRLPNLRIYMGTFKVQALFSKDYTTTALSFQKISTN